MKIEIARLLELDPILSDTTTLRSRWFFPPINIMMVRISQEKCYVFASHTPDALREQGTGKRKSILLL